MKLDTIDSVVLDCLTIAASWQQMLNKKQYTREYTKMVDEFILIASCTSSMIESAKMVEKDYERRVAESENKKNTIVAEFGKMRRRIPPGFLESNSSDSDSDVPSPKRQRP